MGQMTSDLTSEVGTKNPTCFGAPQPTRLGLKDVDSDDSGCLETLFGTSRSSHQRPKDASFLSIEALKEGNSWRHAVKPF